MVESKNGEVFCIDFREENNVLKPSLKSVNLSTLKHNEDDNL